MVEQATDKDGYRFERKFLISELDPLEVKSLVLVHPSLFRETYPPRYVNNIYLDTAAGKHYFDNVDGLGDRVKVRVRWYGALFGVVSSPILELKIKKGLLGRKESMPVASFELKSGFNCEDFAKSISGTDLPEDIREAISRLRLALLNRYERRYFVSASGHFRLTLDTAREFYRLGVRHNVFLEKALDEMTTVLELKYSPEHDDVAGDVTTRFPFRMTKSSKYVQGIEQVAGL